jgi:hypothetical protein
MRLFDPKIAFKIREWADCQPDKGCGTIVVHGMPHGFCCRSFADRIQSDLPYPMDEELLQRIFRLTESNTNFPRILNRDPQPALQPACVSPLNADASSLFISGIPSARDTYPKFPTLFMSFPVDVIAVFSDLLAISKRPSL